MKEKITALLEVRKIIAFITIILFCVLSVMGVLETNFIQNIILTVIAFYFAKSTALDKGEKWTLDNY